MAREALCQQHVTPVNFRGLESSGGPSWKWGKGLSVAPAMGHVPGPAGKAAGVQPGQTPTGGPCWPSATREGCANLTQHLASQAGARGGAVGGGLPAAPPLPSRLREGSWSRGRGREQGAGRGGVRLLGGCPLTVGPPHLRAEAVRGEAGTEWRGDPGCSLLRGFLPQPGPCTPGHSLL